MYQLVSKDDLGRRMVFPLLKTKTVIGRENHCDIVLDDVEVSREHVKLFIIDGRVNAKDMGSSNGTYLNNLKLDKMTALHIGDELIIGPNMFRIEEVDEPDKEEAELTCMLTISQLREMQHDPIPERPEDIAEAMDENPPEPIPGDEDAEPVESTMVSNRDELLAGIYKKQVGLAKFPSVELIFGPDAGKKFLLYPGEYTIGRGDKCNIRLADERVSTKHGSFIVNNEGDVVYKDLDSLNGSILNNKAVQTVELQHMDTLMIGKTKVKFYHPGHSSRPNVRKQLAKMGNDGPASSSFSFSDITDFVGYYWYIFAGLGVALAAVVIILLLQN